VGLGLIFQSHLHLVVVDADAGPGVWFLHVPWLEPDECSVATDLGCGGIEGLEELVHLRVRPKLDVLLVVEVTRSLEAAARLLIGGGFVDVSVGVGGCSAAAGATGAGTGTLACSRRVVFNGLLA